MGKKINELGSRYGILLVILMAKSVGGRAMWLCKCDCGNEAIVSGVGLRSGHTKSCGCLADKIDKTGNRYERLLVIRAEKSVNGKAMWLCKCDCTNEVVVAGGNLQSGHTKSCGCLLKQMMRNLTGVNHPRYTTGIRCGWGTREQREFHESIRERDRYTCQKCSKTQEQELKDIDRRLSVHHKDGDHFNNTRENTTTLCQSCHKILESEIRNTKQDAEIQWAVYEMENHDCS